MTDREKAIVMAHTGICMLAGEKFGVFHAYIEDIMGRPVYTHELAIQSISDEIKEKSRDDFIKLCKEEQEPCSDAISRQAVLDLIEHYNSDGLGSVFYGYEEGVKFADAVNKLPPVTPQSKTGHWIPVSEKLPDKEGYYLCSVRYMYPPYNFFEPEKVKYMDDVTIQKFDGEFNIEVKAWMPLPTSFEPQERSDKE